MEVPKATAQASDGSGLPTTTPAAGELRNRNVPSTASTISPEPTYAGYTRSVWESYGFIFGNGTVVDPLKRFIFQEDGTVTENRGYLSPTRLFRSFGIGFVQNMYDQYRADSAHHNYRSANYPYRPVAQPATPSPFSSLWKLTSLPRKVVAYTACFLLVRAGISWLKSRE